METVAWRVPPYDNGMYLVIDARGDALLVDPSMGDAEALRAITERGLRLVEILNTHGHPDHIYGNAAVKEATRARLAIHRLDAYRLSATARPGISAESRALIGGALDTVPEAAADDLIEEGPLGYLRDARLVALHTPGHTEGSTCFHLPDEGVLFSGDLLFAGNVGRVDLPGGDAALMEASLRRVAALPPETRVYPGHGPPTTIGAELPWLRGFRFG
ncbi:MAG TPA: MBL fold metallo-hydrolase [Candidatus Limnocylindrales bacterium]|nr:MBL fold metallo-hydrolase [Candidatus Limnocylindrales bacterium]